VAKARSAKLRHELVPVVAQLERGMTPPDET
jgi:hypothetical protein